MLISEDNYILQKKLKEAVNRNAEIIFQIKSWNDFVNCRMRKSCIFIVSTPLGIVSTPLGVNRFKGEHIKKRAENHVCRSII